jgi:quinolinate synthase
LVLAHPECDENILRHSDYIGSTTSIIKFAHDSNLEKFIIATEPGVIHQMEKESPQKTFIPLPSNDGCACNECPHMRLNTIEKMVTALETMEPEIILSEELRLQALAPLERMLALS